MSLTTRPGGGSPGGSPPGERSSGVIVPRGNHPPESSPGGSIPWGHHPPRAGRRPWRGRARSREQPSEKRGPGLGTSSREVRPHISPVGQGHTCPGLRSKGPSLTPWAAAGPSPGEAGGPGGERGAVDTCPGEGVRAATPGRAAGAESTRSGGGKMFVWGPISKNQLMAVKSQFKN